MPYALVINLTELVKSAGMKKMLLIDFSVTQAYRQTGGVNACLELDSIKDIWEIKENIWYFGGKFDP